MSLPSSLTPAIRPPERAENPSHARKLQALEDAAAASKTPFKTLVAIAAAESNFDVNARNRRSSASGPFQMTERTWLQLVKRYGADAGRGDLAALVTTDAKGVATVSPEHRAQVLDARRDMDLAAKMAAKLCDENRTGLTRKLGREPSEAEVRMAYFLGLSGAARLIAASDSEPHTSIKKLLPQAYANHRPMLSEAGRPLTAGRAADVLEARYTREIETAAVPGRRAAAANPALPLPPTARPDALPSAPAVLVAATAAGPALPLPPMARPNALPSAPAVLLAAMEPAPAAPVTAEPPKPEPEPPTQVASAPKELECRPTEGGIRCTL